MVGSNNDTIADLGEELQAANLEGRLHRELIVVQNKEQNEKTVLKTLTEDDMDIDRVHIVKLEKVVK